MGIYKKYQDKRQRISGNPNPYYNKVYAKAVYLPKIVDTLELARRVQKNVSVKISDVLAVLAELSDVINVAICNSEKVRLDGLGVFKASISTTPSDGFDTFTAQLNIKSSKILFTPELDPERTVASDRKAKTLLRGIRWTDIDAMGLASTASDSEVSLPTPSITVSGSNATISAADMPSGAKLQYNWNGAGWIDYVNAIDISAGGTLKARVFFNGSTSKEASRQIDPVMP